MKKSSLLYMGFWSLVLLALLNLAGLQFYFYWTIWWYDIFMHAFAGFIGGLIIVWFIFDSGIVNLPPRTSTAVIAVVLALVFVGVAWEIFEYVYDIAGSMQEYSVDTYQDLVADLTGAIIAAIIGVKDKFRIRGSSLL